MQRTPSLEPADVDDVHFGNGNGSGEENRNVARMASLLALASEEGLGRYGREPLARVVSRAVSGVEPHRFGIGPVQAVSVSLKRAGLAWDDIGVVELNEAFAAQSIACMRHWPDLDPGKVNPNGGAVALGHLVGA